MHSCKGSGALLRVVQSVIGILLRSPVAVAKAAATLPGVHTKRDTIQNINRQEQDGTTFI